MKGKKIILFAAEVAIFSALTIVPADESAITNAIPIDIFLFIFFIMTPLINIHVIIIFTTMISQLLMVKDILQ